MPDGIASVRNSTCLPTCAAVAVKVKLGSGSAGVISPVALNSGVAERRAVDVDRVVPLQVDQAAAVAERATSCATSVPVPGFMSCRPPS